MYIKCVYLKYVSNIAQLRVVIWDGCYCTEDIADSEHGMCLK